MPETLRRMHTKTKSPLKSRWRKLLLIMLLERSVWFKHSTAQHEWTPLQELCLLKPVLTQTILNKFLEERNRSSITIQNKKFYHLSDRYPKRCLRNKIKDRKQVPPTDRRWTIYYWSNWGLERCHSIEAQPQGPAEKNLTRTSTSAESEGTTLGHITSLYSMKSQATHSNGLLMYKS